MTYEPAAGAAEVDAPAVCVFGLYPAEYQMGTMLGSARRRFTFPTNSSSRLPSASYATINTLSCMRQPLLVTCIQNCKTSIHGMDSICARITHEMALVRRRELENIRPSPCGLFYLRERRLSGEEDQVLRLCPLY